MFELPSSRYWMSFPLRSAWNLTQSISTWCPISTTRSPCAVGWFRWNRMPSPITWPSGSTEMSCFATPGRKFVNVLTAIGLSTSAMSSPVRNSCVMWCD